MVDDTASMDARQEMHGVAKCLHPWFLITRCTRGGKHLTYIDVNHRV